MSRSISRCGIEWLGGVVCADETPPLARVAEAVGPYLRARGRTATPIATWLPNTPPAPRSLYHGDHYDLTLALARLGNLPFFWIACLVVYLWGKRYYGAGVGRGGFAVQFPAAGAGPRRSRHGRYGARGLLGAAFLSALAWLERPDLARSIIFGVTMALAMLSKYSALVFLPAALFWRLSCLWSWSGPPHFPWRARRLNEFPGLPSPWPRPRC